MQDGEETFLGTEGVVDIGEISGHRRETSCGLNDSRGCRRRQRGPTYGRTGFRAITGRHDSAATGGRVYYRDLAGCDTIPTALHHWRSLSLRTTLRVLTGGRPNRLGGCDPNEPRPFGQMHYRCITDAPQMHRRCTSVKTAPARCDTETTMPRHAAAGMAAIRDSWDLQSCRAACLSSRTDVTRPVPCVSRATARA